MNREGFSSGITPHQRISSQRFNGLIELKGIRCDFGKYRAKRECSCCQNLFRNGIGSEKRQQPQQVGGSWILLFNLLKGERPGGSHRGWVISNQSYALSQRIS